VLRRRKSTFIHGIEDDARDVIGDLTGYLRGDPPVGPTALSPNGSAVASRSE